MSGTNLEKMSRKELLELREKVEKALIDAEKRERKEALKAAEKAAAEFGFSLSELAKGNPTSGKTTKAKYKNPADPNQTWSGRGRKPQWIHEALKSGANISDLEI